MMKKLVGKIRKAVAYRSKHGGPKALCGCS